MSEKAVLVRVFLFISVALNVLLIGAIGGAYLSGARLQRQPEQQALVERMPGPRGFIQALPQEMRQPMRERFRQTWAESRALRTEAGEARIAAFAAASQEPFDRERVRAAFARLRATDQAAIGAFHDTVIDAFAELSPENRAVALEALRRAPPARRDAVRPAVDGEAPAETLEQRREERRERFRQRRRERLEGQTAPAPQ